MNGPEHYTEAERLLATADEQTSPHEAIRNAMLIQTAQVHATLALAAATVETAAARGPGDVREDWTTAVS